MYFAGMDEIYYCASVEDAAEVGLGKSRFIYEELQKPKAERMIAIVQMPLKSGQESPMRLWQDKA
ncbi:hypothetical protein D3C79_1097090 [compost metagenome]